MTVPLALLVLLSILLAGCGKKAAVGLQEYKERTEEARGLLMEGRYAEALGMTQELLSWRPEEGRDSVIAEAYTLAALCEERLGRYELALANFNTAMQHARDAVDQRLERQNKLALARFYFATGEYAIARQLASEAAAGARVFSDSSMLGDALTLSADADGRSGETDRGLRAIGEIEAFRGDRSPALMRLRFDALRRAGRDAGVRELLARWAAAGRKAPDPAAAMSAAYAGGLYQEFLGNADSALAHYSTALTMLDARGDSLFAAELFGSLGTVAYRLRLYSDARRYYADALERSAAAGNALDAPIFRLAIAACDWKTGARQPVPPADEPAARCAAILEACREKRNLRGEALAQFLLGAMAEQRGDPAAALTLYRGALAAAQALPHWDGDRPVSERLSDAILAGERSGWYKAPARLSAELGDARSVLDGVEREYLDDIGAFFLESSLRPADAGMRAGIEALRWKRRLAERCGREIERELAAGTSGNQERLAALLEASRERRDEEAKAAAEVSASRSDLKWILTERSLPLRALQDSLPEGSALVEYALAPKRLSVLVVRKDTLLMRGVDVESARLLGMIGEYNRLLGDAKANSDGAPALSAAAVRRMRDLASIISEFLVDPVLAAAGGSGVLYVVPPSEFGWLPVHTLRTRGGGSLMEERPVKYLPSAALLFCVPVPERFTRTVAGFGHPGGTNWDVEYELKDIRSFFDKPEMAFDTAATVARLTRLSADVVHVAADFTLAPSGPDRCAVVLSDGVTRYGRARIPLGALGTMAASQTLIVSNVSASPGGLRRYAPALFLAGGNRTVIATMWRGDRKSKRYFGEIFYTNLSTGLPAGDAFRSAVLAMIRKSEFAPEHRWGLYFQFGR